MSGSYESGGARLSYFANGSGIPVVFLHPTPLDHEFWIPLVGELSPQVSAIVPDLRGHGDSELGEALPTGEFDRVPDAPVVSMRQLAADVTRLLDLLALRAAVFVGCSIGGYALLELWRRAPERVRGLAFVCSKPQADAEPALIKRAANIAIARESGVNALFDGMANMLIGESSRRRRPDIAPLCRARMTQSAEAFVAVQAGLATRPDSIGTVATIERPVLAIAGGEDTAISPLDVEAFTRAPGACDFHVISDAGHFAAYEQPKTIAGLLSGWLRQFGR